MCAKNYKDYTPMMLAGMCTTLQQFYDMLQDDYDMSTKAHAQCAYIAEEIKEIAGDIAEYCDGILEDNDYIREGVYYGQREHIMNCMNNKWNNSHIGEWFYN